MLGLASFQRGPCAFASFISSSQPRQGVVCKPQAVGVFFPASVNR